MANNSNDSKKYISLARLSNFLDNIKEKYSQIGHKHHISDLTDYTVDTELSPISTNPVQNKILDAEFDAIATSMNALDLAIDGKADANHSHSNYVPTSRTINGISLSSNITLSASDVGALPSTTAIPSINGLATEIYVDDVASTKVDKVSGKGLSANDYTTTEKNKLSGIASGAEVNQNAFSNVVVGSTTIAADSKTDSLTIAAGTGISVSGDATNDKVTITNSGVRSIATGSSNGTISVNTNGASADVAVKGLGSAAYTASTAYDAAGTATTKANAALTSAKEYTDTVASGKADSNHNHNSAYDSKGSASSALASAKTYADSAATTAANKVKNDLLNGAGTAYDTLKELGDLIDDNQDAIDALETVAAGKADKTHSHTISDVSGLQTALDGKAASSHGTHVSYSTTAPVMDGTASVGSASTVARSDHKHPTDTSRASKTEFDTHAADTTAHMTSTQKTQLSTAYNHSQAAHAPSNAQANQNAFSNIAVSGQTTVAADTTTDTVTFVGSNVTITTDATNDKVTFSVADGSTSAKGVVQLTNSTSSTSTTTAATPSSVRSAYDLANTAKTNAATAQTRADAAYSLAEGKADSLADLGVSATATELNYVDGVTSNIQIQLDAKATSSDLTSHISSKSNPHDVDCEQIGALPSSGGTMTGTLHGDKGITLTASVSSANNDQGVTLYNGENMARISLGNSGGFGIYSDQTLFIRPGMSEGSGYGIKMTKSDMSPTTNASLSLGTSSSMQYNNIYGKAIYQNGKQVANKEDIPTTASQVGAVSIVAQELTDEQKAQARANIRAVSTYSELPDKPVVPPNVNSIAHQYAISDSKEVISNASEWTKATSPSTQRERACIYANGYYVVVGVGGEVVYSIDQITWTKITPFVSGTLTNITYGKGKFIIVDEYSDLWMAEESPVVWTKIELSQPFIGDVGSITYANNQFVIAGENFAAFSEDGYQWLQVEAPGNYNQITFGNGRYVAVGANGAVGVSFDGKTWVDKSNTNVTVDLRAVSYADGRFFIGGLDGLIMYTEDFTTWHTATSSSAGVRYVRDIVRAENKFYAATYTSAGAGEIWVSDNGEEWAVHASMPYRLWCLNYNDGRLITAGDSGAIYVLDFGIEWLNYQPELTDGQYLWERVVFTLSDGDKIVGDNVYIGTAYPTVAEMNSAIDGKIAAQIVIWEAGD